MVSQDSPPHPDTTNILHQFITTQTHFDHHHHHHHQHQHHSQHFDNSYPSNNDFRAATTSSNNNNMTLFNPHHHHHHQQEQQQHNLMESAEMSHTRRLMDLLGATTATSSNDQQRLLSLSLNSHNILIPSSHTTMQQHHQQYNSNNNNTNTNNYNNSISVSGDGDEYPFNASLAIAGSRYLRPTQSLLEEIVSVGGREVDLSNEKFVGKLFRCGGRRGSISLSAELRAEFCGGGIVSPDKQQAQMRLAKLISLLEEVENRYEKYYRQMEEVMSTFEVIAGQGTARSYTALALQAMSRHFCSLRDAVVSRINCERRKLAHDLPKISAGLSQLSLFDRDSNKSTNNANRISLQQLGFIQSHQRQAWRPIRGLPETSVAILRAWLFEHFLNPYPNDSEKLMLASQTGLSKNQVSNWFINARVRLWKPMIEEMYKEEFGDSSEDSNPLLGGSLANEGVSVTDHDQED